MGWPLEGTDQAEGPNPSQIDHRRPPQAEKGRLQCPLHDPRIRTVALTAKKTGVIRPTWRNGEIEGNARSDTDGHR